MFGPSYGIGSADPRTAATAAMQGQIEWWAQGETYQLAVRLTETTVVDGVAVAPCPHTNTALKYHVAINDPLCLDVGYILPTDPPQRGYLTPVAFECAITRPDGDTTFADTGVTDNVAGECWWIAGQGVEPKKGDLFICTPADCTSAGATLRFRLEDGDTRHIFGTATVLRHAAVTLLQRDNIAYLLAPSDLTGVEPGSWGADDDA